MLSAGLGTIIWTSIAFLAVVFLLGRLAWKPILNLIKEREESIEAALQSAEKARSEISELKNQNEALLAEARLERDKILREARDIKEKMIGDAKKIADDEARKMIEKAQVEIERQKSAAISELKQQVAGFSLEIATKLVGKRMEDNAEQRAIINEHLNALGNQTTNSAS
ncbi:MAG: F0F1 ATP synthase subunit B [Bacteroidetes bacterium]|nr:F0F1 ATP synthase subunit B [Bacteroidota bacterium]